MRGVVMLLAVPLLTEHIVDLNNPRLKRNAPPNVSSNLCLLRLLYVLIYYSLRLQYPFSRLSTLKRPLLAYPLTLNVFILLPCLLLLLLIYVSSVARREPDAASTAITFLLVVASKFAVTDIKFAA